MRFRACRRLIVIFALLCQVFGTMVVHVPVASAAGATGHASSVSNAGVADVAGGANPEAAGTAAAGHAVTASEDPAHCPDHAQMGSSSDDLVVTTQAHADASSSHGSDHDLCKSGFCKCACAHPPAMTGDVPFDAAVTPHPPVTLTYHAPAAPVRTAPFFRPPI